MTPYYPAATPPTYPHVHPHPHPRSPTPLLAVTLDLDTQIEQLEQRLVAREAWLLSTARSLGQRAQQAVTPTSWVLPILGGGVALWLGWRWSQRRRRTPALPVSAAWPVNGAVRRSDVLTDLPWAGLIALGWSLLPRAWRLRFSPATATAAVSTGLSIVRRLLGRRVR